MVELDVVWKSRALLAYFGCINMSAFIRVASYMEKVSNKNFKTLSTYSIVNGCSDDFQFVHIDNLI